MPSSRSLPPLFLLPAWSKLQLLQWSRVQTLAVRPAHRAVHDDRQPAHTGRDGKDASYASEADRTDHDGQSNRHQLRGGHRLRPGARSRGGKSSEDPPAWQAGGPVQGHSRGPRQNWRLEAASHSRSAQVWTDLRPSSPPANFPEVQEQPQKNVPAGEGAHAPIRKHGVWTNRYNPSQRNGVIDKHLDAVLSRDPPPSPVLSAGEEGPEKLNAGRRWDKDSPAQQPWLGIDPKKLMIPRELEASKAQSQDRARTPARPSEREEIPSTPQEGSKVSLYEELFPNEARGQREHTYVPISPAEQEEGPGYRSSEHHVSVTPLPSSGKDRSKQLGRWKDNRIFLMYIGGATTDLSEADFHRVIPRGAHISAWRAPGDFLHIIPGRVSGNHLNNMVARRWYVLVFGNLSFAQAYRANALRMHEAARAHTPTSLMSPPLPPHGFYVGGTHVREAVADYTLFPPSELQPDIKVLNTRENFTFQTLLENKGYSVLQGAGLEPKAGRSVRFYVSGWRVSEAEVERMLARNGRDRGLQWTPFNGSGRGDMVRLFTNDQDEQGRGVTRHSPGLFRWLITFADQTEARRFVRTWHLRPFRLPVDDRGAGEPLPRVHAEFVW